MTFHGGATQPARYLLAGLLRNNFTPSRIGGYPHIFGGLPATVMADDILSDDPGRIRALIVFAGNPVISFPDTAKMEAALGRLDLLVSLDIYHSDTATFGHYSLPAATQFEKSSIHFMVDKYEPSRRIEWRPKVVDAAGEARPEWHILQDILVAADAPFLNNPDVHREVVAARCRDEYYPETAMYEGVLPDGITLDAVMATPGGIELDPPAPGEFFALQVKTPDRRLHLAPADLVASLPGAIDATPTTTEEYPLLLISGYRRLRSFNSWTHNMPSLTARLDEPAAHIHPDTAASHDIRHGDTIELGTSHGTITITAVLTDRIRPDTVAVPQFWGHTYDSGQTHARERPGVNINRLHTTSHRDQFTGMPNFNARPCNIRRAP